MIDLTSDKLFGSYGWVFGAMLSDEDIAVIESLRDVATATNSGSKIAITGRM